MFLGWSSSKGMFGMSEGPRGGLKWLIILIFRNLLLVNQQCQKIDTWHITLINLENSNPVWPNDFDLQLGCCISDAFSIFYFTKEIVLFKKQSVDGDVRFVSVMTDFVAVASYNFSEIEEAYTEMINKVGSQTYYFVQLWRIYHAFMNLTILLLSLMGFAGT